VSRVPSATASDGRAGGYAETRSAPEQKLLSLPASMSFPEAAAASALIYDHRVVRAARARAHRAGRDRAGARRFGGVGVRRGSARQGDGAKVLAGIASPEKFDLAPQAGA